MRNSCFIFILQILIKVNLIFNQFIFFLFLFFFFFNLLLSFLYNLFNRLFGLFRLFYLFFSLLYFLLDCSFLFRWCFISLFKFSLSLHCNFGFKFVETSLLALRYYLFWIIRAIKRFFLFRRVIFINKGNTLIRITHNIFLS